MRPEIICHMMSTVDGRIIDQRWLPPFGETDIDVYTEPYFEISRAMDADAEMGGRKTAQLHHVPDVFDHEGKQPARNIATFIGSRATERLFNVIDPMGKLLYKQNTVDGKNVVATLSESVSEA